jgi:hypothetical protein
MGLEPRAWGGPLEDDDLLAQQGILGEESGARAEQAAEGPGQAGHQFMDHRGRLSAEVGTVGIRWPAVAGKTLEFRLADRVSAADRLQFWLRIRTFHRNGNSGFLPLLG